jgi:hypothetical protein
MANDMAATRQTTWQPHGADVASTYIAGDVTMMTSVLTICQKAEFKMGLK